jgi:hypothetical protein
MTLIQQLKNKFPTLRTEVTEFRLTNKYDAKELDYRINIWRPHPQYRCQSIRELEMRVQTTTNEHEEKTQDMGYTLMTLI